MYCSEEKFSRIKTITVTGKIHKIKMSQQYPNGGDLLVGHKKRWQVTKKLHVHWAYHFYEIRAVETGEVACCKVECKRWHVKYLTNDVTFLWLLSQANCTRIPQLLDGGNTPGFVFACVTLCKPTLQQLLGTRPSGRFTLRTVLHIGIEILDCMRDVHNAGLIIRDVQLQYFATQASNKRRILLVDVPLARQWRLPDGRLRPQRERAYFRGNYKFSSVDALRQIDQSRKDDCWSWLFVLVELCTGVMTALHEQAQVPGDESAQLISHALSKEVAMSTGRLLENTPPEFVELLAYAQSLQYQTPPDYDSMRNVLQRIFEREGFRNEDNLDWEQQ